MSVGAIKMIVKIRTFITVFEDEANTHPILSERIVTEEEVEAAEYWNLSTKVCQHCENIKQVWQALKTIF